MHSSFRGWLGADDRTTAKVGRRGGEGPVTLTRLGQEAWMVGPGWTVVDVWGCSGRCMVVCWWWWMVIGM